MRNQTKYNIYRNLWVAADWVFPPECAGCGKPGFRFCPECVEKIEKLGDSVCPKCGTPNLNKAECEHCNQTKPPYASMQAYAIFKDPLRKAIHRLKYKQDLALSINLAEPLIEFLKKSLAWKFNAICTIPISKERRKERGYNQANLLALPIALSLGKPLLKNALQRTKNTISQVGLNPIQRRENVKDAFRADSEMVKAKSILLLDDVITTGATMDSCTRALLLAGAKRVYCLSVARAIHKPVQDQIINEYEAC